MMKFLIAFKTELLAALLSSLATVYLTFSICSWYYNGEMDKQATRLGKEKTQAVAEERKVCADNNAINERIANDLQEALTDTRLRAIDLAERLRRAGKAGACVPITSDTVSDHGSATGDVHVVQGGVMAGELISAADSSDTQAQQLIACQTFIRDTWAKHQYKPH